MTIDCRCIYHQRFALWTFIHHKTVHLWKPYYIEWTTEFCEDKLPTIIITKTIEMTYSKCLFHLTLCVLNFFAIWFIVTIWHHCIRCQLSVKWLWFDFYFSIFSLLGFCLFPWLYWCYIVSSYWIYLMHLLMFLHVIHSCFMIAQYKRRKLEKYEKSNQYQIKKKTRTMCVFLRLYCTRVLGCQLENPIASTDFLSTCDHKLCTHNGFLGARKLCSVLWQTISSTSLVHSGQSV